MAIVTTYTKQIVRVKYYNTAQQKILTIITKRYNAKLTKKAIESFAFDSFFYSIIWIDKSYKLSILQQQLVV